MTELPSFDITGPGGARHRRVERHRRALRRASRRRRRQGRGCGAPRRPARRAGATRIAADGGTCLPVACDVTDRQSIVAAIATAEDRLGPLSILVNNAGVVVSKPLFEHTEEDWDYVVDTNLKGAWLAAREFAHHLVEKKRPGRIVNISSILGFRTIGRVPAYCAAKAGPDAPDARAGDGAGALRHSRQRAGAGLHRDRFQPRLFPDRCRQGADRPHPAEAHRSGAAISTARCCSWPRRRAPMSPARSSRSMAATALPRSDPRRGSPRFLAEASGARHVGVTRAGAAGGRRDPGELGLRGRIFGGRLRRTSSGWCCAPTRRPASRRASAGSRNSRC